MSQPSDLEIEWVDQGVEYRLTGRMGPHGPELTGVEISAVEGLNHHHLRAPIISTFTTQFGLHEGEIEVVKIRRGRPRDPSAANRRLGEVARIARAAEYGQRARAVADWFGVSIGYARQLISSAGKAGHEVWR
jgi:hypothetical protein